MSKVFPMQWFTVGSSGSEEVPVLGWGGGVCLRGLQLWLGARCSLGKQKTSVHHQLMRLRLWQLLPEPLRLAF